MSSVGIQLVKRQIRDDESCEPSAMEALFFPLVFFPNVKADKVLFGVLRTSITPPAPKGSGCF